MHKCAVVGVIMIVQQVKECNVRPMARLRGILSNATERVTPIQPDGGAEPRAHAQSATEKASLVVVERRPKVGDLKFGRDRALS